MGSTRARIGARASALYLLALLMVTLIDCSVSSAQQTGQITGHIVDPTGAVVTKATVSLSRGTQHLQTESDGTGNFIFNEVGAESWTLTVAAEGFAPYRIDSLQISAGQKRSITVRLQLPTRKESVMVPSRDNGLSLAPEENAGAMVLSGHSLDALSDDPDELRSELQALAGPAAGPNGGDIYIDGFTGGQLPPKSSIREIHINQNPFSAESEHLGYGSIEILTKPGSDKFGGYLASYGTTSTLNTSNPLVARQPEYHFYFLQGTASGPLGKNASWFGSLYDFQKENNALVVASSPTAPSTILTQAYPNPSSLFNASIRVDFSVGKNNTISIRDAYNHSREEGAGVGAINLAKQSYTVRNIENDLQLSDTAFINTHLLNQLQFQWRRIRNKAASTSTEPSVTVQGAFVDGGNSIGKVEDHQDLLELADHATIVSGNHTIRVGGRLRSYHDSNYSTSQSNGSYYFSSLQEYFAGNPALYSARIIANPRASALLVDGAVFAEDDWKAIRNLVLSYGLRLEGQNRIHDHLDWAPRVSVAWGPKSDKGNASTIFHAGYGWFYQRFIEPGTLATANSAPYLIQAIHNNGINQRSIIVPNPPLSGLPPGAIGGGAVESIPNITTVSERFHAALNMQAALGMDRQLGRTNAISISYIYTRGVHQYFTDEVTAPAFDPARYVIEGSLPQLYNSQFSSGGVYREHQLVSTVHSKIKGLSVEGVYALTGAKTDAEGVTWEPSVPRNPGLDYARAAFAHRHMVFLIANYTAPFKIQLSPVIGAQSGTPYNVTVGSDLTQNNQFNARPTYGTCGAADVVRTVFGCLDTNPVGKGEKIVPRNLGTGPANLMVRLSISRAFGVGPRIRTVTAAPAVGEGSVSGGMSGGGSQMKMGSETAVPRRFNLTLSAIATNAVNYVNWGPPNGTLLSPLFGRSQSLATGMFESPTPGNRTIVFRTVFSF